MPLKQCCSPRLAYTDIYNVYNFIYTKFIISNSHTYDGGNETGGLFHVTRMPNVAKEHDCTIVYLIL